VNGAKYYYAAIINKENDTIVGFLLFYQNLVSMKQKL
jgi:hypothetical protein